MISLLFNHLNPSSNEKIILDISYLTRLEIRIGKLSIDYMSSVQGISQRMQGITIERIIPFFAITTLDHNRYPGVKSCYLVGYAALVNCDLLKLSSLLYIKES